MDYQITASSIISGSEHDFLQFRALCQLEPVIIILRLRECVRPRQSTRLREFLRALFLDDIANAKHFTKRRESCLDRNKAQLVKEDANTLVLLGLCLSLVELCEYNEKRLGPLLNAARALGSQARFQPVFQDNTVQFICLEFKDQLGANAKPVPSQSSPATPMSNNRININSVLLQHRIPPAMQDTHSHLNFALPPIVLPPPSALSLGSTSASVPSVGLINRPTLHGINPDFKMIPSGLGQVCILTCSKQDLLPFLPKPPAVAVFQKKGPEGYGYEMIHGAYGKYKLFLLEDEARRLPAAVCEGDRIFVAAGESLERALQTGKAPYIFCRNMGCTLIDNDIYIIWKNVCVLRFLKRRSLFRLLRLKDVMSKM